MVVNCLKNLKFWPLKQQFHLNIFKFQAEWPPYWTVDEWCRGFRDLLTCLSLEKVHLFGAALGGFLAQKFAEYTRPCPRVASLILCNTFTDTTVFKYADQSQL